MSARTNLEIGKVKQGRYLVEGWNVERIRHCPPMLRWRATRASRPELHFARRTFTEVCEAIYRIEVDRTFVPWPNDRVPASPAEF